MFPYTQAENLRYLVQMFTLTLYSVLVASGIAYHGYWVWSQLYLPFTVAAYMLTSEVNIQ